ncbi:MAG: DUF362 domain-containing protein [Bacteroidales bacterium]|nr:DUF362 domain-containing protein [Bacteroidales bacterium]MCB9013626.1 DUF362 domain-containing protein [Bacteroidales bacterium]
MKIFTKFTSLKKTKIVFFFLGISSLVWFLVRVIPKPSRATYPCMRATAPVMSAFIVYLIGLLSTVYIFKKENRSLLHSRFTIAALLVAVTLFSFSSNKETAQMNLVDASYFQANAPIGEAKGIFPGRVVWVYNQDVTNASMPAPSDNNWNDYWALDKNCNQEILDSMLTSGIRRVGGRADIKEAWDNIFKYFNNNHGRGNVGYTPGEKFAIKINLTNSCCNTAGPTRMDATPQMLIAILHQLVDVLGVPQSDIWLGDNYRKFRDEYYNKCHAVYPNVHYVDGNGGSGREKTVPSSTQLMQFSDGISTASLPRHYVNATYFINIPCLKTHDSAGITLAAKNHQGSILSDKPENGNTPETQSAYYMHPYYPDRVGDMHTYRHLVDYIGHKELGGKTLIYIIDGIWAGRSWEGYLEKWQMAPFNGDYPSSLFLSQDPLAIESVCYDFLLTEYASKPTNQKYPYMAGVDDYLQQAADPANWPSGIKYDPEGDGTFMTSQGVYEHWNNATDMQYSRDLGTGNGIEFTKYTALATDNYTDEAGSTLSVKNNSFRGKIYPNPFSESLKIETGGINETYLSIYNIQGKEVYRSSFSGSTSWNASDVNGARVSKGNYLIRITDKSSGKVIGSEKVVYK